MPPSNIFSGYKLAWVSSAALVVLITTAVVLSQSAAAKLSPNELKELIRAHESPSLIATDASLPPFFPLLTQDYFGFACAIFGLIIAAGGGIGGGGILVPVYTLVLNFPVKQAIALTAVTVLGGAVANNLLNMKKRHPLHPSRPCIDWDLILLLEPMTMAGAMAGTILNQFLPGVIIIIMLLLLLSLTAYKTLTKGVSMYQKESQALARQQEEQRSLLTGNEASQGSSKGTTAVSYGAADSNSKTLAHQQTSNVEEKSHQVWVDAIKLASLFVLVTGINFLKGGLESGESVESSFLPTCNAFCFWSSNVFIAAIILGFVFWTRSNVLERLSQGGPIISDIAWDGQNTIQYPLYAVGAGLVAGLFGVGGGIVKGPLMIALGVHPAVASATSACMILFTSSTATFSFYVFGRLTQTYAVACMLIGFVSTLVGQCVMTLLLKRYQRHSYVVFSIGTVVALSAVCMTAESVLAVLAQLQIH